MKKYLNTKELCEVLGLSRVTLYRYREEGLPHIKISYKVIRYDLEEVERWMKTKK